MLKKTKPFKEVIKLHNLRAYFMSLRRDVNKPSSFYGGYNILNFANILSCRNLKGLWKIE